MGFRSASILTLIISGIIIGCTDAVSTNYHDRTSYYSDKAIETQGNDSNLLIVFYVQIMPDDFVMQLHRF